MANEIARFKKSETEQIVVSLDEYKNKKGVDVRVYFKTDEGRYLPSQKGVRIAIKDLSSFAAAVAAAEVEAKNQGWLD